jgi:subtilisin family serine protease
MSLGTETSYDTIKDAIDYADSKGVLLIASAGYEKRMDVRTHVAIELLGARSLTLPPCILLFLLTHYYSLQFNVLPLSWAHVIRNGASFEPQVLTNFPADYPNVLSVAAVDKDKRHASFRCVLLLLLCCGHVWDSF